VNEELVMLLHEGGQAVTYEELVAMMLPEPDGMHSPASFHELVQLMRWAIREQAAEVDLEEFRLGRDGAQALLVVTGRKRHMRFRPAIGIRCTTDKSAAMQCALGGAVGRGNYLMLRSFLMHRRNTIFSWHHAKAALGNAARQLTYNRECIQRDDLAMRATHVYDETLAAMLGIALLNGVMTAKQVRAAYKLWQAAPTDELYPRTAWAAFCCCTEALKTNRPTLALDRYVALHKLWTEHRPAFGRRLVA
jgi:hypothetical protein